MRSIFYSCFGAHRDLDLSIGVRSRILSGCESLRRSHLQHDFWCVRYAAVAYKRAAQQIAKLDDEFAEEARKSCLRKKHLRADCARSV